MKCKFGRGKDFTPCKKPANAYVFTCEELKEMGACHEGRLECAAYSPDCPFPEGHG